KAYGLVMQHPWCKGNFKAIQAAAAAHGMQVDGAFFNPGLRDFRLMLSKALAEKPDLILLLTFSPEIDLIITQADKMGARTKLTTVEAFDYFSSLKSVEGCTYVGLACTEDFAAKFRKR